MTYPGTETAEMPLPAQPAAGARPFDLPPAPSRPGPPISPGRRPSRRLVVRWAVIALVSLVVLAVLLSLLSLVWRERAQPNAWGGFENGRIPAESLCAVPGQPAHRLRCDAAAAYGRMATAYRARFGTRLCITDSYRSYEQQVKAQREKPELTAEAGTSNHGWGLAVDLCGGVNSFARPQHRWVVANGPTYGWVHPKWAAKGKPRAEPWHFEFRAP